MTKIWKTELPVYFKQNKINSKLYSVKNVQSTASAASLILLLGVGLATTNTTRPPGGDETNLATSRRSPLDCGRLTNMLMVTTTVGVLNWVHGHTTHLRPAVTLDLVLVVCTAGLQDGLVDTTATSNNT